MATALQSAAAFLGGFVAGEGCFGVYENGRRFVFSIKVADRDARLIEALQQLLGAGTVLRSQPRDPKWLPQISLQVNGRRQHLERTVPFMESWLPRCTAKWKQFEKWRDTLMADVEIHPFRVAGVCAVTDCGRRIRGQGLCRQHYYRVTGY